jgi:hypothetical protein
MSLIYRDWDINIFTVKAKRQFDTNRLLRRKKFFSTSILIKLTPLDKLIASPVLP